MTGNNELNEKYKRQQEMLMQHHCEKHEYIIVTQTTTSNGPTPINESHSWLQCKHCGSTHPIPSQQRLVSK